MKMPKVLFFIASLTPNKKERDFALSIGATAFRNASQVAETDPAEKCDAVSGFVIPSQYYDKPVIKSFQQVIEIMQAKHASADMGETADDEGPALVKKETESVDTSGKKKAAAAWKANA